MQRAMRPLCFCMLGCAASGQQDVPATRAAGAEALPEAMALAADDSCAGGVSMDGDDTQTCALQALQMRGRKVQTNRAEDSGEGGPFRWHRVRLHRTRRSHRFDEGPPMDGSNKLEGAAFADYSADVTVAGQTFQVIVDTGSSDFAIAASPMSHCIEYLQWSQGSPGQCDGQSTKAIYGSGNWTGRVCSGFDVSLAGFSAGQPRFAGILTQQHFLTQCRPDRAGIVSEGIVGMAYRELTSFNEQPLFDSVVQTARIPNVFSMQCCGWNGQQAGSGQLILGGVDPDLHTGGFQYTPITREAYYCVNMLGISVAGAPAAPPAPTSPPPPTCKTRNTGGTCFFLGCDKSRGPTDCKLGFCRCKAGYCASGGRCTSSSLLEANHTAPALPAAPPAPDARARRLLGLTSVAARARTYVHGRARARQIPGCNSIIDSGTSALVLHHSHYEAVLGPLQEAAKSLPAYVRCINMEHLSGFPDITIQLQGDVVLRVPPTTYFQPNGGADGCMQLYLSSAGKEIHFATPNVLGQPLMEAYYTVFDRANQRVGFAPIAGCS